MVVEGDEGGGVDGFEVVGCSGRAGMMTALEDVVADVVDGVCVLLGV